MFRKADIYLPKVYRKRGTNALKQNLHIFKFRNNLNRNVFDHLKFLLMRFIRQFPRRLVEQNSQIIRFGQVSEYTANDCDMIRDIYEYNNRYHAY